MSDLSVEEFLRAASDGRLDYISHYLSQGGNVNEFISGPLSKMDTALHKAADAGQLDVVEKLVAEGAIVNQLNKAKQTPLHRAVSLNRQDVIEHLMTHGAKLNLYTKQQFLPLHIAAAKGHLEVVKFLMAKGCDPAARTSDPDNPDEGFGQNALHVACASGKLEVVKFLISKRPELMDMLDSKKNTVFKAAEKHPDVLKELKEARERRPKVTEVFDSAGPGSIRILKDSVRKFREDIPNHPKPGEELEKLAVKYRTVEEEMEEVGLTIENESPSERTNSNKEVLKALSQLRKDIWGLRLLVIKKCGPDSGIQEFQVSKGGSYLIDHRKDFVDHIEADDILDHLIAAEIVTARETEDIKALPQRYRKVQQILDICGRHKDQQKVRQTLKQALNETGQEHIGGLIPD